MGRSLADAFPESRAVFETADRVLERRLSELCFSGDAAQLALTENTQPAVLTTSVAACRALAARGLRPAAAAGHSLGEYSAHVAAGSLSFEDALRAVQLRGRFMQDAVPVGEGAMAAVIGLPPDEVVRICREASGTEIVSSANFNSPLQVVIAGHAGAVSRAMSSATAAGARRVVRLDVSAPFHCALMRPAAERLRPVLEAIAFADPTFPVFGNVEATPVGDGAGAREALVRQVTEPVRWTETIERMIDSGIETFVEVGPGRVLAGLVRGIRPGMRVLAASEARDVLAVADELGPS